MEEAVVGLTQSLSSVSFSGPAYRNMAHHLMSRMDWISHLKTLFDKHKVSLKKHDKLLHTIKKR